MTFRGILLSVLLLTLLSAGSARADLSSLTPGTQVFYNPQYSGNVALLPTTPTQFVALQGESCGLANWLVPVDQTTDSWLLIGYGVGNNPCNPNGPNSGPLFFPVADPFLLGSFSIIPASLYQNLVMTITFDPADFAITQARVPESSGITLLGLGLIALAALFLGRKNLTANQKPA